MDFVLDCFYHIAYFSSGISGPLCQFSHFVGDNSKPSALFTRAGGFNGSIEGKKIGLICYIIDYIDNLSYLIRPKFLIWNYPISLV